MSDKISNFEKSYSKKEIPQFNVGDTVKVYSRIKEEGKTRIQMFEGIVIKKKGSGVTQTFTVRKVSYGEGVERVFPLHSPNVDRLTVTKKGSVKRSKLYYLRKKIGKKTKIEEEDAFGEKAAALEAERAKADAAARKEGQE